MERNWFPFLTKLDAVQPDSGSIYIKAIIYNFLYVINQVVDNCFMNQRLIYDLSLETLGILLHNKALFVIQEWNSPNLKILKGRVLFILSPPCIDFALILPTQKICPVYSYILLSRFLPLNLEYLMTSVCSSILLGGVKVIIISSCG